MPQLWSLLPASSPLNGQVSPRCTGVDLASAFLSSVVVSVVIWNLARRPQARAFTWIVNVAAFALLVADSASLVRTAFFDADPTNNLYELNELLAAPAGRVPDSNFIPQYNVLFTYLLKPHPRAELTAGGMLDLAIGLLSSFGVATVVLGVYLVYRALDRRSFALAVLLVVPITCVTTGHGTVLLSSISAISQELPLRVFPGVLLFKLASGVLVALNAGIVRRVLPRSDRSPRRTRRVEFPGFRGGRSVVLVAARAGIGLRSNMASRGDRVLRRWHRSESGATRSWPMRRVGRSIRATSSMPCSYAAGFGAAPIEVLKLVLFVLPVIAGHGGRLGPLRNSRRAGDSQVLSR